MQATKASRNGELQNQSGDGRTRRGSKNRQANKLRRADQSVEGGDSTSGGSAAELGKIGKYPSHVCEVTPDCAHHYHEILHNVFCCEYCLMPLYQPHIFVDATRFADEIRKYGKDKAYAIRIGRTRRVKGALEILMAAHIARASLGRKEIQTAITMVREHYGEKGKVEMYDLSSARWWNA